VASKKGKKQASLTINVCRLLRKGGNLSARREEVNSGLGGKVYIKKRGLKHTSMDEGRGRELNPWNSRKKKRCSIRTLSERTREDNFGGGEFLVKKN